MLSPTKELAEIRTELQAIQVLLAQLILIQRHIAGLPDS